MADANETEQLPTKKTGKIIVAALAFVVVAGGAAYFALAKKPEQPQVSSDKPGPVVPLDTFIVNLDEPGATRYLKLTLDLEMSGPQTEGDQNAHLRIRDEVIVLLSGLRVTDIQKGEDKQKLKKQLIQVANGVFGGKRVRTAYFKEFVIQ